MPQHAINLAPEYSSNTAEIAGKDKLDSSLTSSHSISNPTASGRETDRIPNNPAGPYLEPIRSNASRSHSRSRSFSRKRADRVPTSSFHRTTSHVSSRSGRSYGGEDGYSVSYEAQNGKQQHQTRMDGQDRGPEAANGEPNGHALAAEEDDEEATHDKTRPDVEKSAFDSPDSAEKTRWEVKFSGDTDPLSPRSMSPGRKWLIVFIIALSSLCVTCTSTLYTFTYNQLTVEFQCSRIVATLGVSIFVMGLGLGPMVLSPLSEFYGRKPVYIGSYVMFVVWMIPCAVARNTQTMLIARFFDGLAGSAFLSVAGGTVGDMFDKRQLSLPMMVYAASPFIGPELGPIVGGFINQYVDWRWSFYVLLIWSGLQTFLIIFLVPETYHPVLLRNKARELRKTTGEENWWAPIEKMDRSVAWTVVWSCVRPFQLLFFEPMCLNLCLLSAVLLGILYLFFGAFPLVFENNHGFTLSQVGLSFSGILVGMAIGIGSNPLWQRNYSKLVRLNGGVSEPEFRLPSTVLGAWLVVIGLFGFGWTTFPWVHWIVPIVFSGIFGLGNIYVFSGVFTFLVECYPMYAASSLAANSFARSSFAAAFPLFGVQMYTSLGYQWATTLLAFLSLILAPFPYIFYKYGKQLRSRSRFASAKS